LTSSYFFREGTSFKMEGPLLEREPAKGRTTKRSFAVLVVGLITTGALVSIMAQRIGVSPLTEMFGVAVPNAGARISKAMPPTQFQRLGAIAQAKRKDSVVLLKDVDKVGKAGQLVKVKPGFMRNFLFPRQLAGPATEAVLAKIQKQKDAEEAAKVAIKEKAYKIQTALSTIGKFTIKRKVGEGDKIFGSVSEKDVVEAINLAMSLDLDKSGVVIPDDMSKLGTYDASIKLHPEVYGNFKVVVAKDTST
jgi:large subunit ribosomal protein L9